MKNHLHLALVLSFASLVACGDGQDQESQVSRSWGTDPVTFSASGRSAADIQSTVDAYRAALGDDNGGTAGSQAKGRREINWDGVPANISAPNFFPGEFFQTRGLKIGGWKLQVSSKVAEDPRTEFANLNNALPKLFNVFSAEKLFSPVNGTTIELTFNVPGDAGASAAVSGFGAVFSDVDRANISKMEYYDRWGKLIATVYPEAVVSHKRGENLNETLSFVGIVFKDNKKIAKVKVTTGNTPISSWAKDGWENDLVVLDDFIYGEPQAIH